MTILSEIRAFLDGQIKEHASVDKPRNIELICYYYGFGDSALPIYDEIAQRFDGFKSRQRTDQILDDYFRNAATADQIPSLRRFQDLLSSQPLWGSSPLESAIAEAGFAGEPFSLRGLIRLLDDLKVRPPYATYSPDLEEKSLRESLAYSAFVVLKSHLSPDLRALLQYAKNFPDLPGRKSIARIEDVENANDSFDSYKDLIFELIRRHPETWICEREDGTWFVFENRENTLINHAKKALTAFGRCDLTLMPEAIYKALLGRRNDYRYPSADLIEDYLRSSRHFVAEGNTLSPRPPFASEDLSPIETDLVELLRQHDGIQFRAARIALQSLGYTAYNIRQTLYFSPLVFVDKTRGRGNYTYHSVGISGDDEREQSQTETRYETYRNRLEKLQATDIASEQQTRGEQDILRDWLFAGKETKRCALCRKVFSVKALVAAHKKRRADCNEGERRDPHIAMPLCQSDATTCTNRRNTSLSKTVLSSEACSIEA